MLHHTNFQDIHHESSPPPPLAKGLLKFAQFELLLTADCKQRAMFIKTPRLFNIKLKLRYESK